MQCHHVGYIVVSKGQVQEVYKLYTIENHVSLVCWNLTYPLFALSLA